MSDETGREPETEPTEGEGATTPAEGDDEADETATE